MFHMSDEEHSASEDHGGVAHEVSEKSPFLSRSTKMSKPDTAPGVDHADDAKHHGPGPSSVPADAKHHGPGQASLPAAYPLETVEEAAETPSDLTNSVLDQLRDLRAGASSIASSVVHSITGSKH
jgi:hypothetical protein